MKRPEKEAVVAQLTEQFRNADAVYLTEYRGLTVPQVSELREKLGRDTSYTVAKNTLARIAANKAKDYLRSAWVRKMNTPGDEVLALEGAPPGMQPEQQVLDALGEEELTGMILNLREPYCTPCRLVLLEQHTMAEAARLCGRPPKTVEAQVYRAKKMLAQQILQNDRIPCERRSVHGTV